MLRMEGLGWLTVVKAPCDGLRSCGRLDETDCYARDKRCDYPQVRLHSILNPKLCEYSGMPLQITLNPKRCDTPQVRLHSAQLVCQGVAMPLQ